MSRTFLRWYTDPDQINRFTAQAPPACSTSRSPRTSLPSPLSTTPAHRPSVLLPVVVALSSVAAVSVVVRREVVALASRESVLAVARAAIATMTTAVHVATVVVVLAGRTTTSRREPVSPRSTCVPTGRCWRRLTSTGCPS